MRIAVTGGAGYIGSVVSETLVAEGHAVLVMDNLSKGHRDAVPVEAEFAEIDLKSPEECASALSDFQAQAVIHMAASSLVGESVTAPDKYYANNLTAGLSLLEAMRQAGVGRIVFSSTAAVYGEPLKQPIEESDPLRPTNPYGETKLAFERALHWYGGARGVSSVSLRYFNAAGATVRNGERHDPETHLIPLVLQAAAGEIPCVTILGDDYPTRDGTCVRDYIHVRDLAKAHVLALGLLDRPGLAVAYNLGCGGVGHTVLEIVETARRLTGRTIPIRTSPRRAGDPAVLVASAERFQRDLSWSPNSDLAAIITSAWEWMRRPGTSLAAGEARAQGAR